MATEGASVRLGVDVGGTFTDLVLLDDRAGSIWTGKTLTTRADPTIGIRSGVLQILNKTGISVDRIAGVIHGTTLVANTLIERKGSVTGLITTAGYRDVIEIGSELRYDTFDLFIERPLPLVPRNLRLGLDERINSSGDVLRALDPEEVRRAARRFAADGVESVAVAFFNSYRNAVHEDAALAILEEELPEVHVSLSSRVAPEIREYERFSTTVADAYVKPTIRRYMSQLEAVLHELEIRSPLYIMLSNGGITDAESASNVPIQLIESGPAAGALAAGHHGLTVGEQHVIAFDMGGTTAKACLIRDGVPTKVNSFEAARVHRFRKGSGIPLRIPVIDMIEIGAGGGSIAQVDEMNLVRVGPESAGSDPGPACYGRGGSQATVTDANVVLGLLDPSFFLGGEMALSKDLAEEAIHVRVGSQLDRNAVEAAAGIHRIVNNNMATAVRVHIAEQGFDPRSFSLVAFGGAGPVHAYGVAKLLGLQRILCPPAAGVASALGMLMAPPMVEMGRSYVATTENLDWPAVRALCDDMQNKIAQILDATGLDAAAEFRITAEMRFIGQGHEIGVDVTDTVLERGDARVLDELFLAAYERQFGRRIEGTSSEVISWRVNGALRHDVGQLYLALEEGGAEEALKGRRPVYFPEEAAFVEVDVYNRYALRKGANVEGPAVIEERESTIVVGPGASAHIDEHWNVLIDMGRRVQTKFRGRLGQNTDATR